MIRQLKNNAFTKILWGLMALYLLNISVDSTEPILTQNPEGLAINPQESIIEILVEQVLGYEDAIKEYDDNDKGDRNKKSNIKIDLFNNYTADCDGKASVVETKKQKFPDYNTFLNIRFQELDTPPPKA